VYLPPWTKEKKKEERKERRAPLGTNAAAAGPAVNESDCDAIRQRLIWQGKGGKREERAAASQNVPSSVKASISENHPQPRRLTLLPSAKEEEKEKGREGGRRSPTHQSIACRHKTAEKRKGERKEDKRLIRSAALGEVCWQPRFNYYTRRRNIAVKKEKKGIRGKEEIGAIADPPSPMRRVTHIAPTPTTRRACERKEEKKGEEKKNS